MRTIALFALIAGLANASDFDSQLKRVKDKSSTIREKLQLLGFKEEGAPGDRALQKASPDLYSIHGENKRSLIRTGDVVRGEIQNRLVVASDPHPVLVKVTDETSPLWNGVLMGFARGSSNPDRVQIEIGALKLSAEHTLNITAIGLDPSGSLGVPAKVFTDKAWSIAGGLAGSFISGLAIGSQTESLTPIGTEHSDRTSRNAILQGLATSSGEASKRLLEEATREKPVLVVPELTPVIIYFEEDVRI